MQVKRVLTALLAVAMLLSCGPQSRHDSSVASANELFAAAAEAIEEADNFSDTVVIRSARGLQIDYQPDGIHVAVSNPDPSASHGRTETFVVARPASRFICTTALQLGNFEVLGLEDRIVGMNSLRNLFSPLKAQSQFLRFVFLTGISKFSQLSVFSELNNLQQLTFAPEYEGICGITEEELLTEWKTDIEELTEKMKELYERYGLTLTYDDVVAQLKKMYDGYHFSDRLTDIYCPWSLVNAFAMGRIMNFWFSTGTPTMLINVMRQNNISIQQIEHFQGTLERFDAPTERISDPIPVLFQSGYLTLKEYKPIDQEYVLGFPNGEVREGFAKALYKYYMEDYVGSQDTLGQAFNRLRRNAIGFEQFIETIQRWYAGIPYSITDKNQNEQLYQSLIYAALMGYGADVSAEEQTADGRMDIALKLPDCIYIIELKYGKTAEEAVEQVVKKNYAVRFASDKRPVTAVGLNISEDRRTIDSYKIVQVK